MFNWLDVTDQKPVSLYSNKNSYNSDIICLVLSFLHTKLSNIWLYSHICMISGIISIYQCRYFIESYAFRCVTTGSICEVLIENNKWKYIFVLIVRKTTQQWNMIQQLYNHMLTFKWKLELLYQPKEFVLNKSIWKGWSERQATA